jgi:2-dehydro-3-deoxy-L-rhamnonate dehydrogenase (NAD+)
MTDRTVLTTGANSGIGLATVVEVAKRGFHSVGSVRSAQKAKVVRQAARAAGVEVDTVLLDVTDAGACEHVMADLDLYGLVNNAGYALTGAIEDVGDDEARELFETMVHAPMRLARLALPSMRARGGGRIVNISSIAGKEGNPMAAAYSSSKAGVIALTKAIGKDVAGSGILVNCIAPAVIDTPLLGQVSEEHVSYMTSRIPLGRMGRTDEVASLICWLASEEMSFSTGACFDISGGRATY